MKRADGAASSRLAFPPCYQTPPAPTPPTQPPALHPPQHAGAVPQGAALPPKQPAQPYAAGLLGGGVQDEGSQALPLEHHPQSILSLLLSLQQTAQQSCASSAPAAAPAAAAAAAACS